MRFSVLLATLLCLVLGLPGVLSPSARAASETVVVTSSGPSFPWGLLGVLGLMGLARRQAPGRQASPAQPWLPGAETGHAAPADPSAPDLEPWPETEAAAAPWPEAHWGQVQAPPTAQAAPAQEAAAQEITAQNITAPAAEVPAPMSSGLPQQDWPQNDRPSERLRRRQSGAPDLSKPPGRR